MEKLKRLTLSLTLVSVIAVSAFAGETETPPCVPGETSGPPSAAQSVNNDPMVPGQTEAPPALPAASLTDIAETLLWSLLLF